MDKTTADMQDFLLEDTAGADGSQKAELDAACENLGALRSDLEQLLSCIHAKSVSRRQVPGLLKEAYARLQDLRESHSDIMDLMNYRGLASKAPAIAALIDEADSALQLGDAFSLDDAAQTLEKACKCSVELDGEVELVALIFSRQAGIAAIQQDYRRAAELYAKAATQPKLKMQLQWRYQNNRGLILEELGREFKDNAALEQAVDLYKNLVVVLAPKDERPEDWATTQNNLGTALGVLGQRHRGTQLLERSIEAFENALNERTRERAPLDWATTQNNLGNSLGVLGQRQGDTEMLAKSVEAFENALKERTQEKVPHDWAATQNNLGAALHSLGARSEGTKLLSKSVAAYKKVLEEWTRNRVPLDWATTLHNLGTVLRALGERQSGTRSLEKSIAAYKNALKERTRERVPQDWAMTQNNLGAALQTLGESHDGTQELEDSVAAYENALKEWTREHRPMTWAMTMANLGVARRTLAERSKDVDISRLAVADFQAAVDFFRAASHAQYVELADEQLKKAREVWAALGGA